MDYMWACEKWEDVWGDVVVEGGSGMFPFVNVLP